MRNTKNWAGFFFPLESRWTQKFGKSNNNGKIEDDRKFCLETITKTHGKAAAAGTLWRKTSLHFSLQKHDKRALPCAAVATKWIFAWLLQGTSSSPSECLGYLTTCDSPYIWRTSANTQSLWNCFWFKIICCLEHFNQSLSSLLLWLVTMSRPSLSTPCLKTYSSYNNQVLASRSHPKGMMMLGLLLCVAADLFQTSSVTRRSYKNDMRNISDYLTHLLGPDDLCGSLPIWIILWLSPPYV